MRASRPGRKHNEDDVRSTKSLKSNRSIEVSFDLDEPQVSRPSRAKLSQSESQKLSQMKINLTTPQEKTTENKFLAVFEEKIVIHRMPYMLMNDYTIKKTNCFLFILIFVMSYFDEVVNYFIPAIAALFGSFCIFIYPGLVYYFAN